MTYLERDVRASVDVVGEAVELDVRACVLVVGDAVELVVGEPVVDCVVASVVVRHPSWLKNVIKDLL